MWICLITLYSGFRKSYAVLQTCCRRQLNKSSEFKMTHQDPCSVVACSCFPDEHVRTYKICLKIITTYLAGVWWAKKVQI